MPAAYYDITVEEGTSYALKLKFKDSLANVVNLNMNDTYSPSITSIPVGFEKELTSVNTALVGKCGVFAKMQVRNSVNAGVVELNPINSTDSGPVTLFGESYFVPGSTAIQLSLSTGLPASPAADDLERVVTCSECLAGACNNYDSSSPTPNIKLTMSSFITRRINFGNYLYDLELVYFKLPTTGIPNFQHITDGLDSDTVVFRILQGRFVVTPSISR